MDQLCDDDRILPLSKAHEQAHTLANEKAKEKAMNHIAEYVDYYMLYYRMEYTNIFVPLYDQLYDQMRLYQCSFNVECSHNPEYSVEDTLDFCIIWPKKIYNHSDDEKASFSVLLKKFGSKEAIEKFISDEVTPLLKTVLGDDVVVTMVLHDP